MADLQKKLIALTREMWAAIDAARGDLPRNPWIENALRDVPAIKQAAEREKIDLPDRDDDGRGRWKRD